MRNSPHLRIAVSSSTCYPSTQASVRSRHPCNLAFGKVEVILNSRHVRRYLEQSSNNMMLNSLWEQFLPILQSMLCS